ncbi:hypothetical protein BJY00DRAFT_72411 [Aspergillus carlsbadensis]|nr:hypothetical protein BJY00DRAFT_72411 [Aspergillus carlsbadensis]
MRCHCLSQGLYTLSLCLLRSIDPEIPSQAWTFLSLALASCGPSFRSWLSTWIIRGLRTDSALPQFVHGSWLGCSRRGVTKCFASTMPIWRLTLQAVRNYVHGRADYIEHAELLKPLSPRRSSARLWCRPALSHLVRFPLRNIYNSHIEGVLGQTRQTTLARPCQVGFSCFGVRLMERNQRLTLISSSALDLHRTGSWRAGRRSSIATLSPINFAPLISSMPFDYNGNSDPDDFGAAMLAVDPRVRPNL